jgi:hypothetical protein
MIFRCVRRFLFDSLVSTAYVKIDLIRTVTLPHLEPFGISNGLELKVSPLSTLI